MLRMFINHNPVPPRVQAAMQYIHFCRMITDPDESSAKSRALNKSEQAAYEMAMAVLRGYFSGEMDYGDAPPRSPEIDGSRDAEPNAQAGA